MGLFDIFFKNKEPKGNGSSFEMFTAYSPSFRTWRGQLYESELIRAAIDAKARHVSKLSVRIDGSAKPALQTQLRKRPNKYTTWSQFFYRLSTILDVKNTAFVVKVYNDFLEPVGIAAIYPTRYELVEYDGEPWLRFYFPDGKQAAERLVDVGIITKYQLRSDFFGETNNALDGTMSLIDIQQQAIREAAKNSQTFRYIARVNNFSKSDDLKKEQQRFTETNLREGSGGGLLLFPNTYSDIKQVDMTGFQTNPEEEKLIQENVFNYFGVNSDVLQNAAIGDKMDAFFNGSIEPFAIQVSDVLTQMLFTDAEQGHGSRVIVTADRLQYMSVSAKVSMAQQLGDRGALTIDEIRALFNYGPLPDGRGEHAPIRGEYYYAGEDVEPEPDDTEPKGDETEDTDETGN